MKKVFGQPAGLVLNASPTEPGSASDAHIRIRAALARAVWKIDREYRRPKRRIAVEVPNHLPDGTRLRI